MYVCMYVRMYVCIEGRMGVHGPRKQEILSSAPASENTQTWVLLRAPFKGSCKGLFKGFLRVSLKVFKGFLRVL